MTIIKSIIQPVITSVISSILGVETQSSGVTIQFSDSTVIKFSDGSTIALGA